MENKNEEKIKEIVEKYCEDYRVGYTPIFNEGDLVKDLQEYGDFIRQQTLEEAMKCVPEEEKAQFGRETSWEMEHANGHNSCRQQTLSNLQALKDK